MDPSVALYSAWARQQTSAMSYKSDIRALEIRVFTVSTDSIVSLAVGDELARIWKAMVSNDPPSIALSSCLDESTRGRVSSPSGRMEKPEGNKATLLESHPVITACMPTTSTGAYTTIDSNAFGSYAYAFLYMLWCDFDGLLLSNGQFQGMLWFWAPLLVLCFLGRQHPLLLWIRNGQPSQPISSSTWVKGDMLLDRFNFLRELMLLPTVTISVSVWRTCALPSDTRSLEDWRKQILEMDLEMKEV